MRAARRQEDVAATAPEFPAWAVSGYIETGPPWLCPGTQEERMDLNWFLEFVVLAETLHYANAAEKLYTTQSTLSKRIQAMEKELGAQLFVRGYHKLELTPFGRVMLPYAYDIIQILAYLIICGEPLQHKLRFRGSDGHICTSLMQPMEHGRHTGVEVRLIKTDIHIPLPVAGDGHVGLLVCHAAIFLVAVMQRWTDKPGKHRLREHRNAHFFKAVRHTLAYPFSSVGDCAVKIKQTTAVLQQHDDTLPIHIYTNLFYQMNMTFHTSLKKCIMKYRNVYA